MDAVSTNLFKTILINNFGGMKDLNISLISQMAWTNQRDSLLLIRRINLSEPLKPNLLASSIKWEKVHFKSKNSNNSMKFLWLEMSKSGQMPLQPQFPDMFKETSMIIKIQSGASSIVTTNKNLIQRHQTKESLKTWITSKLSPMVLVMRELRTQNQLSEHLDYSMVKLW